MLHWRIVFATRLFSFDVHIISLPSPEFYLTQSFCSNFPHPNTFPMLKIRFPTNWEHVFRKKKKNVLEENNCIGWQNYCTIAIPQCLIERNKMVMNAVIVESSIIVQKKWWVTDIIESNNGMLDQVVIVGVPLSYSHTTFLCVRRAYGHARPQLGKATGTQLGIGYAQNAQTLPARA